MLLIRGFLKSSAAPKYLKITKRVFYSQERSGETNFDGDSTLVNEDNSFSSLLQVFIYRFYFLSASAIQGRTGMNAVLYALHKAVFIIAISDNDFQILMVCRFLHHFLIFHVKRERFIKVHCTKTSVHYVLILGSHFSSLR